MADSDKQLAGDLAEFLEFVKAKRAAEAEDNDPDNDRDVTLQRGDQVITMPWRKAKEYDLDGLLAGWGLKRKAAPAGKGGGSGDSDSGQGGAPGGGKPPANVRDFFGARKAAGSGGAS